MLEKILRKGKKFLKEAVFSSVLIGSVFLSNNLYSQEKEKKIPWRFFIEGGIVPLESHSAICKVSNVPERLRYAPIHPDDDYASEEDNGVIAEKEVKRIPFYSFPSPYVSFGLFRKFDKMNLSVGVRGGYYFPEPSLFDLRGKTTLKTISERNYTNYPGTDKRGSGAALTYYGLANGDLSHYNDVYSFFISPSISPFYFEYSSELSHLYLTRGWDRYNSLEVWKGSKLAEVITHNFIFGVRNFGFGERTNFDSCPIDFKLGFGIPTAFKTSLGKEVNLNMKPNVFLQFKMGFWHMFEKKQNE